MTSLRASAATYGELSERAARLISVGAAQFSARPLGGDALQVALAILSYRRVLLALDRQAREVVGVMRVPDPTLHVVRPPRRHDQHSLFLWQLHRASGAIAPPISDPALDTGTWNDATRNIHAAADLIEIETPCADTRCISTATGRQD